MIKSEPWRDFNINDILHSSFSGDKNGSTDFIDAFSIVQEGNQGGNFYRIISWRGENRYYSVGFESPTSWDFDLPMKDFQNDKIVTFLPTNKLYKVVHSEMFYNILERV
jgi:hypothetical protein